MRICHVLAAAIAIAWWFAIIKNFGTVASFFMEYSPNYFWAGLWATVVALLPVVLMAGWKWGPPAMKLVADTVRKTRAKRYMSAARRYHPACPVPAEYPLPRSQDENGIWDDGDTVEKWRGPFEGISMR